MNDLNEATRLLREGRQLEACQLTADILQQSPDNAEAWALLVLLIDDPVQKAECLRRIVQLVGDSELGTWAQHQLGDSVPGDDVLSTSPAESQVSSYPESRPAPSEKPAPKRRGRRVRLLVSVLLAIIVPTLIVYLGGWWLPQHNPQLAALLTFQTRPTATANSLSTGVLLPTEATQPEHPLAPADALALTQLPSVIKTIAPDPNNLPAFIIEKAIIPYTYPDGTEPNTSSSKFGTSIAIDGNTLVISAPGLSAGEVHVYSRSGASDPWARQAILNLDTPTGTEHRFGAAVAVEGNLIAVSDLADGIVYVYERTGDTWVQQAEITAPDDPPHPQFGIKLRLVKGVLYIGASGESRTSDPGVGGAIFVFMQRGSEWVLSQKLAVSIKTVDGFGHDFAIDGDTLVVGAYLNHEAYIYHLEGGKWFQKAMLRESEPSEDHTFGYSVAISGDTIAVGAPSPLNAAGLAYDQPGTVEIFKDTSARRDWSTTDTQTLAEPAPADTASTQYTGFGSHVELRNNILLVSSPLFSPPAFNGLRAGSIYVFAQQEGQWLYQTVLAPNAIDSNAQMSPSVAVEGQTVYAAWYGGAEAREAIHIFDLPLLQP